MFDVSELPSWMQPLFLESFFDDCLVHPEHQMNTLCLECKRAVCPQCLSGHISHNLLKIRRYMYRDVLRLSDARKLMNCAHVQTYTSNSEKVVFLKPQKEAKPARNQSRYCIVCNKGFQSNNDFCSLICKLDSTPHGEVRSWIEQASREFSIPISEHEPVLEPSSSGTEMSSANSHGAEVCSTSETEEVAVTQSCVPSCRPVSTAESARSMISRRKKSTPFRSPLY